jgi:tetratricopeptide (TPR) repeat protein
MIEQFRLFLGPARLRAFFLLLALTGLASLILNALDVSWATSAQMLMVLVFVVGALVIIGGRLDSDSRNRWVAILIPAVGLILLGFIALPQFLLPLLGAAIGWIVAGALLFRRRMPKEFQAAIKSMRKSNYHDAVQSMNALIREDDQNEHYYRLRAEIFRLWGKLDRARKDYEQMIVIAPESAVAFNGLAEVHLQAGKFEDARAAGLVAFDLAPDEWVAAYNLGMIDDRLRESASAVEHLGLALQRNVPDARHRLLIHL